MYYVNGRVTDVGAEMLLEFCNKYELCTKEMIENIEADPDVTDDRTFLETVKSVEETISALRLAENALVLLMSTPEDTAHLN